jgi:Rad51
LGIAPLDRLLEVFCAPAPVAAANRWSSPDADEGGDLYGEAGSPMGQPALAQARKSKWKPVVIELTSSLPASGKTNLLYYITVLAVLPPGHGGRDTAVVWLDNDGRFSATRLREVMVGIVRDDSESLVQEALAHVHVFRPQSSQQLIETLDSLPSYLLDATAHPSMRRRLGLLVLDSATAFYWQDRFEAETARFERPDENLDKPSPTAQVIARMKELQREFDFAIAFSTSSNFMPASRHAKLEAENAAPQETRSVGPWTALAALTLNCRRVRVPQFASHMLLEEYLRDRENRQCEVAKGRVAIELDRSMSELWTSSVRSELDRFEDRGRFRMQIRQDLALD